MNSNGNKTEITRAGIDYLMNPKNWWGPLTFILIISLLGVGMIGFQTYHDAPPMTGFKSSSGEVVINKSTIENGQLVFHKYALMEYGSMFGDGAQRGPDFTAEALHWISVYMNEYYVKDFSSENGRAPSDMELRIIKELTKEELKRNNYNEEDNIVQLTVEAWRFKNMPRLAVGDVEHKNLNTNFGFPEVFMFLIAVNFWNFFGAGVMGIIINLPIMNYFEHGTYLTINHAHAALMGVYGNISLAAMLFASKLLIKPGKWNRQIVKFSFWSINAGLMLMVVLDLFPAGVIQFKTAIDEGLWFARSNQFIGGNIFKTLTWLRGIGASVFFIGGVILLTWFIITRVRSLKSRTKIAEGYEDFEELTAEKQYA